MAKRRSQVALLTVLPTYLDDSSSIYSPCFGDRAASLYDATRSL